MDPLANLVHSTVWDALVKVHATLVMKDLFYTLIKLLATRRVHPIVNAVVRLVLVNVTSAMTDTILILSPEHARPVLVLASAAQVQTTVCNVRDRERFTWIMAFANRAHSSVRAVHQVLRVQHALTDTTLTEQFVLWVSLTARLPQERLHVVLVEMDIF